MSVPTRLSVLKNVLSTLQGMTGPAYHYAVESASQVTLDPTNILGGSLPAPLFFLIEPDPGSSRTFYQGEQLVEDFVMVITARNDAGSSDPLAKVTIAENLAADLEVALEADMTRGGFACDTRCDPPGVFIGLGSQVVIVTVKVTCKIYRQYGAP